MGRKFLTTPTLPALSSAPDSPSIGDMYFDTTLGKIAVYTTSGWSYLSNVVCTDTSDFARKSENDTITGSWTFSNTTTFSSTPTFNAGLNIAGGASLWTTDEWAKALDLRKGQSLVWRTGGGLAIGIGVIASTNTLCLSSSERDDDSGTVSYPIVFDVENGRIGIGTTAPSEKIEVIGGNIKANGLIGPDTDDLLLIKGANYGVEVRLNGDYSPYFLVRTKPTYSDEITTVFSLDKYGNAHIEKDLYVKSHLTVGGTWISLGSHDYSLGDTFTSIALEKVNEGTLAINSRGNFYGGVRVDGPGMNVTGNLTVNGTITGTLDGNASTASKLKNAINIFLSGSLSGYASFDGGDDININASINPGAVGTDQIAFRSVTTEKIALEAIGTDQIAFRSVTTEKIALGAVGTDQLANESVTYEKLAQDVRDAIGSSGGTRIFQTTIGNGTDSSYTITHNFNTTNVEVSLTLLSTNEKIGAKVEVLNNNQVQVSFISPIDTNSVRVVVIG